MERELIVTGIGGQGIQLLAKTLALAATREGRYAMLAADYGGEMRGGPSKAGVVIGDAPLHALPVLPQRLVRDLRPPPVQPRASQDRLRPGGIVVVNTPLVDPDGVPRRPACVRASTRWRHRHRGRSSAAGVGLRAARRLQRPDRAWSSRRRWWRRWRSCCRRTAASTPRQRRGRSQARRRSLPAVDAEAAAMSLELLEGGAAIAEAAIAAGCRFFAGYPMSPFTGLLEDMSRAAARAPAGSASTPRARSRAST